MVECLQGSSISKRGCSCGRQPIDCCNRPVKSKSCCSKHDSQPLRTLTLSVSCSWQLKNSNVAPQWLSAPAGATAVRRRWPATETSAYAWGPVEAGQSLCRRPRAPRTSTNSTPLLTRVRDGGGQP